MANDRNGVASDRSKLVRDPHQLRQAGWGAGSPASFEPIGDLVPVDVAAVELEGGRWESGCLQLMLKA